MGRKKKQSREQTIEKAIEIFRDHGFTGTSAEMLVEQLEVSRYSIYADFGSKLGLFEAALKRYDEVVVSRNFGPLESPQAGIREIQALLDFFSEASEGSATGRGCLLCNTAVEFGPTDPTGDGFIQEYFERISGAFLNALENASLQGVLRDNVRPREEADFFTTTVLGLFVLLRAKASPSTIRTSVNVAKRHLQELGSLR